MTTHALSISDALATRKPVTFVRSVEERRIVDEIRASWAGAVHVFDAALGVNPLDTVTYAPVGANPVTVTVTGDPADKTPGHQAFLARTDPAAPPSQQCPEGGILHLIDRCRETDVLFVLLDFHAFLSNPNVNRTIRNFCRVGARRVADENGVATTEYLPSGGLVGRRVHVVIVAPAFPASALPTLQDDVAIVEYALPAYETLLRLVQGATAAQAQRGNPVGDDAEVLGRACLGLTHSQARDVLALSAVREGKLSAAAVLDAKGEILAKGLQGAKLVVPTATMADVAGIPAVAEQVEIAALTDGDEAAAAFGCGAAKGLLFGGPPGTGKSLVSEAIASALKRLLVIVDIGRAKGSLVGQSQENLSKILEACEAMGAVVMLDELEKSVSEGTVGASGDSGTSSDMVGMLLTWLQTQTKCYVVATTNQPWILPVELTRSGRFDKVFGLPLPGSVARKAVASVHLRKRDRDVASFDLDAIAAATEGFVPAEIEGAIVAAIRRCYVERKRNGCETCADIDTARVVAECRRTKPMSQTRPEAIERMDAWCATHAVDASVLDHVSAPAAATVVVGDDGLGF